MKKYEKNIDDRKVLVARLCELTGLDARYTRMPRCAYEIGTFTVEKDGSLMVEGGADESVLQTLLDEGLIVGAAEPDIETVEPENRQAEQDEANAAETEADIDAVESDAVQLKDEPAELTISMPLTGHSVGSLRRLINLVYSRGPLLSKATGGTFGVQKDLLAALDDADPVNMEDLIAILREHGGLDGIVFDEEKVSFTGFPLTEEPEKTRIFIQLACLMNKHAIEMKHIQAKEIETESEKYTFRNWLMRIGMGTAEFKNARAALMENLSGHSAFRNKAEEEKWKARQKAKRDEQRARGMAAQSAEPETAIEDAAEGIPADF